MKYRYLLVFIPTSYHPGLSSINTLGPFPRQRVNWEEAKTSWGPVGTRQEKLHINQYLKRPKLYLRGRLQFRRTIHSLIERALTNSSPTFLVCFRNIFNVCPLFPEHFLLLLQRQDNSHYSYIQPDDWNCCICPKGYTLDRLLCELLNWSAVPQRLMRSPQGQQTSEIQMSFSDLLLFLPFCWAPWVQTDHNIHPLC